MAFVEARKVGHKEKGNGCSVCVCVCVCALVHVSTRALMGLIEVAGSGIGTEILCHSCLYLQASKAKRREA